MIPPESVAELERSRWPLPALFPRFSVAHRLPARSHVRMESFRTVDESFAQLHRAGLSVGDVCTLAAEGPGWLVSGTNGENAVNARGRLQAEAWHRACQQAEAAGMVGRGRRSFVAQVEGENRAGGGGRQGKPRWGFVRLGDRDTSDCHGPHGWHGFFRRLGGAYG